MRWCYHSKARAPPPSPGDRPQSSPAWTPSSPILLKVGSLNALRGTGPTFPRLSEGSLIPERLHFQD